MQKGTITSLGDGNYSIELNKQQTKGEAFREIGTNIVSGIIVGTIGTLISYGISSYFERKRMKEYEKKMKEAAKNKE